MGKESEHAEELQKLLDEAKTLIGQLSEFKAQSEHAAIEAEAARKRADSEALFASNAKTACEGHSTAIAALKGNVEADIQYLGANKQKSEEMLAGLTVTRATVEGEAKAISDFRREGERLSQELAVWTQKGQEHSQTAAVASGEFAVLRQTVNEYASEAGRAQKQATQAEAKAIEAQKAIDVAAVDIAAKHLSLTQTSTETAQLFDSVKTGEVGVKSILARLVKSDATSTSYENRLIAIIEKSESLTKQTEELLPGATSAGLASAFKTQRERFAKPQERWLKAFVTCIILLSVLSLPSFFVAVFYHTSLNWNDVLTGIIIRLPIAIPLIWLAIYSGRNYMLSIRVEEDYAYKETVSRAFEGYRREMEKISITEEAVATPLTTLCDNVLSALAERPGRIYEGKHHDITPLTVAQEHAAAFANRPVGS